MEILKTNRVLSTTELNIDLAEIKTKSGNTFEKLIIDPQNNSVAAITKKKGKILLIKEKKILKDQSFWELPEGPMQFGETALSAIRRNVEALTGYQVLNIKRIGNIFPNLNHSTREKFIFLVELGDKIAEFNRDFIENISTFTFDQIKKLISQGQITNEKTLASLMLAESEGYLR
jgi:ADP-ribose pyrophosphatase YjhB (NUDIX family)